MSYGSEKWMIDEMVEYAKSFLGTPYIWGGNFGGRSERGGLDCSGFVCEVLRGVGLLDKSDLSAQGLYEHYKDSARSQLGKGSVLFFGQHRKQITHVAIALNDKLMIESGGGNHFTTDVSEAKNRNAMVRFRPIRQDLVAVLKVGEE